MFDTRRLEALVAVADHGSVSAAATALGLTQPAVSHQLARLEQDAGVRLLVREPRGMRTTTAGDALLCHARAALAQLEQARRELDDLLELNAGRVVLHAFPTAFVDLVPEAIARLRKDHPGVTVTFAEASREAALAALAAREADVAVVFGTEPTEGATHLLDDAMLAVLPRAHRLSARRRVSLRSLAAEPWVLGSGELISGALTAAGLEPAVAFETDDLLVAQGIVAAGLAVTLSPALALAHTRPDIVLRPLTDPLARRIEAIVHPASPPAAQALVAALTDVAATLA